MKKSIGGRTDLIHISIEGMDAQKVKLTMENTRNTYEIRAWVPKEEVFYILNNEGRFWKEKK